MKFRLFNCIKYFTLGILILMCYNLNAQNAKELGQENKHFVHVEIGGRTFIWGSMNYEYAISQRITLGAGLGIINIQNGTIIRDNNGMTEEGKYLDIGTSQMISGNYFIGANKHKLHFTAGLTNFLFTNRNKYPSETKLSNKAQLEWNAGIGYQLSTKKMYFRLTAYCISLPDPVGWFPKYMPWLGLTTGFKLK